MEPGRVLAGADRHDSPLLAPILDRLNDLGPLPDDITVRSLIRQAWTTHHGTPILDAAHG